MYVIIYKDTVMENHLNDKHAATYNKSLKLR
jgi:hypothetical protein